MGDIWDTDTPVLRSADVGDLLALHSEHLIDGTPSKSQVLDQRLLEADGFRLTESNEQPVSKRIAIVSLLFNWPSTGGGIVHTAELAHFLSVDGYDVCHFFAVYEPWSVGGVRDTCCSKPKATIAPNGARTSFVYNKLGSQIRTTGPTGAISTTVYDVLNRTVGSIDPLGKRSTTVYDAANRTIASVNALNQRSTTVYNAANQAIANINAAGIRSNKHRGHPNLTDSDFGILCDAAKPA